MKVISPVPNVLTPAALEEKRRSELREFEITRRGAVIGLLRLQYPLPTTHPAVEAAILPTYYSDIHKLGADLGYLQAKGYIKIETTTVSMMEIRTYTLTPLGYDLYEGVVSDPAVVIHRGG